MYDDNSFEVAPGKQVERERVVPPEQDFEKVMEAGVPEFAGDKLGVANPDNEYYGEAKDGGAEETGAEYNAGIADAAALINYGLNAAAREMGVETVVQKIKGFDASGRADPIGDLFKYLGVDTPEGYREVRDEAGAAAASEAEFREGVNRPSGQKSVEGAFKALDDMKELIAEVEGADPRYEELRAGAKAAGKGYFEYAVSGYGVRGLTELFQVLAAQREKVQDDVAETATDEEALAEHRGDGEDLANTEHLNPEILRKED